MFTTTPSSHPADLFSNYASHFRESKRKKLNDPKTWHNVFYDHVTSKVDEPVFSVLYSASRGRPNASIRILVAMLILKEGFGWSDEKLFEQCEFNILVMRALGLSNFDDEVPVASTYYLFKQSLFSYQLEHGCDLMSETFEKLTQDQAGELGTRGDFIRMDSKLIGSNIANCCRLQHIIGTLSAFWERLPEAQRQRASRRERSVLNSLLDQTPGQFVYRLSNEEKKVSIRSYGLLLHRLVQIYDDSDGDQIRRLFNDQFTVVRKRVVVKPPSEIASDSLQSPHDPEAAFSAKAHQNVKGYSVNLTETCNPKSLNLITDVRVEPANHPDQKFLEHALEATESVVGPVREVSADGAYYNPTNADLADETRKQFHFGGMQGTPSCYEYNQTSQGLQVTDTRTSCSVYATEYKPGRYRADLPGRRRPYYFRTSQVKSAERRRSILDLPEAIRHRRNNVEASLFQLSFFTRNNKTRYRGLRQNRLWAICRAAWMNLVRIANHFRNLEAVIGSLHRKNPIQNQPREPNNHTRLRPEINKEIKPQTPSHKNTSPQNSTSRRPTYRRGFNTESTPKKVMDRAVASY